MRFAGQRLVAAQPLWTLSQGGGVEVEDMRQRLALSGAIPEFADGRRSAGGRARVPVGTPLSDGSQMMMNVGLAGPSGLEEVVTALQHNAVPESAVRGAIESPEAVTFGVDFGWDKTGYGSRSGRETAAQNFPRLLQEALAVALQQAGARSGDVVYNHPLSRRQGDYARAMNYMNYAGFGPVDEMGSQVARVTGEGLQPALARPVDPEFAAKYRWEVPDEAVPMPPEVEQQLLDLALQRVAAAEAAAEFDRAGTNVRLRDVQLGLPRISPRQQIIPPHKRARQEEELRALAAARRERERWYSSPGQLALDVDGVQEEGLLPPGVNPLAPPPPRQADPRAFDGDDWDGDDDPFDSFNQRESAAYEAWLDEQISRGEIPF